ncbi:MAG TPA: hypothetical protein VEX86_23325 [Longimicrobium sp.]|nr:hypothetical protein [Longimicrobium sp.]
MPKIVARLDPSLSARVVRSRPLLYGDGADPAQDRPAHVRSASGLVRAAGRLAVIQDDANFVALVDPATGVSRALPLPAGEGGLRQFDDLRGNKRFKLDVECCVIVEDWQKGATLAAFGSGSTALRERIVIVRGVDADAPEVRVVDASALYAALRVEVGFAGSELNVEGVAVTGSVLRLFNRGNGAPRDGRVPVNATCDVAVDAFLAFVAAPSAAPSPVPRDIVQYDLGAVGGQAFSFTDAAERRGAILYAAAAEASPDATRDGPVAGCAIGVIRGGDARYAVVEDAAGRRYTGKIEGILPHPDDPARLWAVVDRDDPGAASELLEVELSGEEWVSGGC